MKKKLIYAAMVIVALASCAENEYLGEVSPDPEASGEKTIVFESSIPSVTRSTGATAAADLGYTFAVYATKKVGSTTSNVFAHSTYSTTNNTPYWVWYNTSTANTTTSNTYDWEYVGAAGNKTIPNNGTFHLDNTQTIKYWDYSADQYDFIAYKATSGGTVSNVTTGGFSFTGTASQLAGLYIADKVTLTSSNDKANPAIHTPEQSVNKIGYVVVFTFRSAAAKVRLGIYETIPGYDVKNVNFRPSASEFTATTGNARLSGSFNGASSASNGTYDVGFNASGVAELDNTATSADDFFDFGTFASETTALGTTSVEPRWAGLPDPSDTNYPTDPGSAGSAAYQNVFPNTDNVSNMILKVDYDLVNATSGETIHVSGATAVVPSIYMSWKPNYAYTYLFKISDNTNGTTGTEGEPGVGDPEGLYPITFDAVTIATTDDQKVGTITTVSTPAITTYQKGSVSDAGITYATASTTEPIYITVNTNGTLASLTADNIKLYTVPTGTTEADLILGTTTGTPVTGLSILANPETKQDIVFAAGTTAKFTPAAGTYAVEYKSYNGIVLQSGTSLDGYYTTQDGSTPASGTADGTTTYYKAVYQYKIIIVAAAS